MTTNQINYHNMRANWFNAQEGQRHNKATESENARHNVATESETNRHNVETEKRDIMSLNETSRHNLATEGETNRHNLITENQTQQNIDENVRHNKTQEGIDVSKLDETIRHNLSTESETNRHNKADENIRSVANALKSIADQMNYEIGSRNATTNEIGNKIKALQYDLDKARTVAQTSHWNTQDAQTWQKMFNDYDVAMAKVEAELANGNKSAAANIVNGLSRSIGAVLSTLLR